MSDDSKVVPLFSGARFPETGYQSNVAFVETVHAPFLRRYLEPDLTLTDREIAILWVAMNLASHRESIGRRSGASEKELQAWEHLANAAAAALNREE